MNQATPIYRWLLLLLLCSGTIISTAVLAAVTPTAASAVEGGELENRQKKLAGRYAKLEELLIKMAKLEAANNPRRANLLNQAMELSKDKHTRLQLEAIANLLGKKQLARAIREQGDVELSLAELLKLLQSEDRSTELKTEQERIKEYIKEVERMIRIQRSLQGQNEGQADAKQIAEEQEKLADRAGDLADKIRQQEEKEQPPSKDEKKESTEKDKPQKSDSPETPSPDIPPSAEKKPGEPKPSEQPSTPMPKGDMPPNESDDSKAAPPQKPNPVRERIEHAQQRMKAAEKKLAKAERKESIAEQEQAREELEKAKAELERILRQLREEEMERTLTALEARFRKMLEMQVKVFDGTKKLDAVPSDQRTREHDVQAGRLGAEETKIALEAEKALQLLEEEGSSVAFPTTVQQLVDDMRSVAERLNLGKTEQLTQGLEEDIISCLEELLAALQQAQKEMEEKKQQQPQQPMEPMQGQQEEPLVDAIQELKMIKSLQIRVNTRTNRYAKLLQDESDPVGQANTTELAESLRKLAAREKQVFEIVREILLGRNK